MYRTGFGDCFLLTFGGTANLRHVLIDFGAHMHGEIGTMDEIMEDIELVTGMNLALIVATHAHRDHISGFARFADRFAQFQIGEIWMPWTDNPRDKAAAAIERRHLALYDRLYSHLQVALGATDGNIRHSPALLALSNLRGNERAKSELNRGFGVGARVRYLGAGTNFNSVGNIVGLSAEILGPPRDKSFLARMDPPAHQRFLSSPGDSSTVIRPFPTLELRAADPESATLEPLALESDILALESLSEVPAGPLAFVLDSVRNNTSLVIVFRFRGRTLLFTGDAQWGNWESWIGTEEAKNLLGEVDFLKVAHHGSANATPVDVVSRLGHNLAAMVSTQTEPYPSIPRIPLLNAIERHCAGNVAVRSDWIEVTDAPTAPYPVSSLPKEFRKGKLWIDYIMENSR
jgi:hypothetical protein